MDELVQRFLERGGAVQRVPTHASSGITKRAWQRMVRADAAEIELPRTVRVPGTLKIRVGHGVSA